ncbi:MAG: GIY-YIG nuclease family protein [Thiolinea sp.]
MVRSLSVVEGNRQRGTAKVGFDCAQPAGMVRFLSVVEGNMAITKRKNMPYMYILKCVDDSYYTGSTWNLEKRLAEHQQGLGARHTAKRLPVKLVFCEFFDRIDDAFQREKQVQGWGRKKKEALIAGDANILHQLAECQNETHWLRGVGFDCAQPTTQTVL